LLYLDEESPAKIQQLLGIHEQTTYDWLDDVAERGDVALGNRLRGGSSTRLIDQQWERLMATLAASPSDAGYDEPIWTKELVRTHIADTFEVEYSLAHNIA